MQKNTRDLSTLLRAKESSRGSGAPAMFPMSLHQKAKGSEMKHRRSASRSPGAGAEGRESALRARR